MGGRGRLGGGVPRLLPLPPTLHRDVAVQAGLLTSRQLHAAGISRSRLTRLCAAGQITRVVRGVYDVAPASPPAVLAGQDRLTLQRRRHAVLGVLAHGPLAVATGLAALTLLGVHGVPAEFTPEATLRHGGPAASVPGVRLRRVAVDAHDIVLCDGIPVVRPELALAQAVCLVDRFAAVAIMDSARARHVVSERAFERARRLAVGMPGSAQAKRWWDTSTGLSQSAAETHARLRCIDAGIPPDALQFEVRDRAGRFIARVDLAWHLPDGRLLLGEIDGHAFHSERRDVLHDDVRQNRLLLAGATLLRWTGTQAMNGTLTAEAAAFLHAAGWTPQPRP